MESDDIKYLGFLFIRCVGHRTLMNNISNQLANKVESWSSRPLSRAGRLVMINLVLLALPIYLMSCYKMPQKIINKIQSSISKFLHNHDSRTIRKLTWDSYDTVSTSKYHGDFGIKNLIFFNQTLLAKNGSNLISNPSSFWTRLPFLRLNTFVYFFLEC